ncbi:neuron navigator 2 isoform X5 [Arapaima gigas]
MESGTETTPHQHQRRKPVTHGLEDQKRFMVCFPILWGRELERRTLEGLTVFRKMVFHVAHEQHIHGNNLQ